LAGAHHAQPAREVTGDDFRVHIAFAADGGCIAEPHRNGLDRTPHIHLCLGLIGGRLDGTESHCRQHRPCPGAEILGRDVRAGDVPQIIVDIGRADRSHDLIVVDILKEVLPGEILDRADDAGDAPIPHAQAPSLPALTVEVETQLGALHLQVTRAQGGEAIAGVVLCVFAVADADQRLVEEAHNRGQDLLARGSSQRHVLVDALSNAREQPGKFAETLILVAVTDVAPTRVIEVLLAAPRIPPRGLNVTVCSGADPHVGPRGWNCKGPDPLQSGRSADRLACRRPIAETGAGRLPANARLQVRDIGEPGGTGVRLRRLYGIGGERHPAKASTWVAGVERPAGGPVPVLRSRGGDLLAALAAGLSPLRKPRIAEAGANGQDTPVPTFLQMG
jgi:hypothetical protein